MKRMVSSQSPLGALSDSMSVTNPYLYWSTSIRRTFSTVSCTAGILPSAAFSRTAGWISRLWLWSSCLALRSSLQAATADDSLSNVPDTLIQARMSRSIADSLVTGPTLTRTAPGTSPGGTPLAASTWEGWTLPEEQAAPEDTATPSRSKAMTAVSA